MKIPAAFIACWVVLNSVAAAGGLEYRCLLVCTEGHNGTRLEA